MRSLLSFAALVAAVGFSGCCSDCNVGGCKLGSHFRQSALGSAVTAPAGDCGCGGGHAEPYSAGPVFSQSAPSFSQPSWDNFWTSYLLKLTE